MRVLKNISYSRFFAQVLFLLVPVSIIAFFLLWNSNRYFSILKDQWLIQTIYFSIGLFIAYFIAQCRFRFLPLFAGLLFLLFSIYQLIDNYAYGEFDSFFLSVQFLVFSYLLSAGWLCGWGLQRISFFPIILSGLFLLLSIYLIAKTGSFTNPQTFIQYLAPVVLFSIYIIYTSESLRNSEDTSLKFWWRFGKRLLLFGSLLMLLFLSVLYLMYPEIKERVEEYGGQGKEGENQLLETKKDGTVQNKQSMGMGANNKRNSNPEPLFCAHINSYLPGTETPNPLYLTSWHFTKFDTLTETFERDANFEFNDEFQPNPSSLQLFSTYVDSTRIKNAKSNKHRKIVEIEIYKKRLSPSSFLGPSTAFWLQPITVEKEFQKEFSSAYRAKSYVSDLNSAYFIYNTDNPEIQQFQQFRFQELRKAKDYAGLDKTFINYYTSFPSALQYQKIKLLADSLQNGKKTTIDKVLAIRDHFLQRNVLGEKIFTYTDNPGVPGLPGSSKLMNFLFESKKGYCAYYAGATLFLLRAMGIPSRIVTGFLTVDRSDKNTGWYWFYEDQSHGWVQVYFPEYGWIDFDTTVGNDEAEQSPKPDGTPPLQPPNPVLALGGKLMDIDTIKKIISIKVNHVIFKDEEFKQLSEPMTLDVNNANIWKDSLQVPLNLLKRGDDVMAVSYREKLKALSPEKSIKSLLSKLPKPVQIDELYIKDIATKENKIETKDKEEENPISYYLKWMAFLLGFVILLILSLPTLVYRYYKIKKRRAKSSESKAYYTYRSAIFLLNQLKVERMDKTPWQFARDVVDKQYNTQFAGFMNIYLKTKYSNQPLTADEEKWINTFYDPFETNIKKAFNFRRRLKYFLNLNTFINFFYLPEPEQIA